MGGQPPARGPDPAHEGLASGPPPCSAITLQSGPRNPSQNNAGFMNDIMRRVNVSTKTKHFGQCRESRCKLRRPLIISRHWLMRSQCSRGAYGDLLYFCKVLWLSRRAMLPRVCDLQKEIDTFLRQFFNPRWLAHLTLLGKDIVIDMHAHLTAFEVKLRLWDAQLANSQLEHFPRLAACVPDDVEPDTCVSVVSLREAFASLSQESGR